MKLRFSGRDGATLAASAVTGKPFMRLKYAVTFALLVSALSPSLGTAQEVIKIGIVMPMSGTFASAGRQVIAGIRLFMQQHGESVTGKKVELIIKDDEGKAEVSKRIAQELIVRDKVHLLGAGLTPSALAIAPLSLEAKIPLVLMISGTSSVTEKSPYIVRTSFTLGQQSGILADWARQNGSKKTVIIQSDFAPGAEASGVFIERFTKGGGQILELIKVPLANPDFAPFLQRAKDLNPDTLFAFVPATGQAGVFAKQFFQLGLNKAGIKLIGTGELTDGEDLDEMGDALLGTVTAGVYSVSHASDTNKAYVSAFKKSNPNFRPNFLSVSGYDGMHLIYAALEKAHGLGDGESLVSAMKGMAWESPRGPIAIDPDTRDIVQNVYIRTVEHGNEELSNIEILTFGSIKDPLKLSKSISR
jgi:branched-chain amino acid transport system substrate-binding protein